MKKIILLAILFSLVVSNISAADTELEAFNTNRHQVGLRLGTWGNNGAIHDSPLVDGNDSLIISFKKVTAYIEGFYAYNLFSSIFAEISFGVVNRGDIQYYSLGNYDFSNLLIYPLIVQFKTYPLQNVNSKFQPFVGGGGGFYFAKQDIQFTNDYYAQYYNINGASKTDFNYTISGGFDWLIRENFALELQGKYMPIKFSENFIGERDYSSTTITIGFKYKYNNIKK